jgi:Na+/proline symporter
VFVPAFFRAGGATPYAYLGARFGPLTRAAGACAFLATRLLVSAVRLLALCVAAGALLGWGLWPALALFTVAGVAALARGGARAAVWTGAFQALVFLGVGALSILFLFHRADGGITAAWSLASAAGKLRALDFGAPPFRPGFLARFFGEPPVLWVAVLTGFFSSSRTRARPAARCLRRSRAHCWSCSCFCRSGRCCSFSINKTLEWPCPTASTASTRTSPRRRCRASCAAWS